MLSELERDSENFPITIKNKKKRKEEQLNKFSKILKATKIE